uniref:Mitochondrial cardiolipin hydrolase n=1 Tax=Xenopsylla cheopis TaxID=163159 RepID=A0A6M2DVP8_XENCH
MANLLAHLGLHVTFMALATLGLHTAATLLTIRASKKYLQQREKRTGKKTLPSYDILISCQHSIDCKSEAPIFCYGCANERCYFANINRMIMIVDSSTKSICLSMYILSNFDLTFAIIEAQKRGVRVRVLTDYKMFENNLCVEKLLENNVPIRIKESAENIMHHKLCLIDTEEEEREPVPTRGYVYDIPKTGAAMLGSQNWCLQALTVNYDNTIITTDVAILVPLQQEFERMWDDFSPRKLNRRY